jgi:hypothetical protein
MLWHLVRGDLRRHRGLLGVWLLLSAGIAGVEGTAPFLVLDPEPASLFGFATVALNLATLVVGVVLAPIVIQSDAFVGSTAFWMTRPIAPLALAASKLLLVFAAGVGLPVALHAGVLAAADVPGRTIAMATAGSLLSRSVWMALTLAIAALTQTLPRYLVALGGFLSALVAVLVLGTSLMAMRVTEEVVAQRWTAPRPTADVVGIVLIVVALAAVAITQARTRQRRVAVAVGTIGVAAAVLVESQWSWPVFDPRLAPPAWSSNATAGRLWLDPASVEPERTAFPDRSRTLWRTLRGRAQVRGMPAGWAARVHLLGADVRLPDGSVISSRSGSPTYPPLTGDVASAVTDAARDALGVERIEAAYPQKAESLPLLVIRDDDFRRVAPSDAAYAARFEVMPTHYFVEARAPISRGLVFDGARYRLEAIHVERGPERVTLTAVESWVPSEFDSTVMTDRKFYLVHGGCRCAVELRDELGGGHLQVPWLPISLAVPSSSASRQRRLSYPHPFGTPADPYPVDDQWLSGAELLLVRADTYPPFERVLTIGHFPLKLPQPRTAGSEAQP